MYPGNQPTGTAPAPGVPAAPYQPALPPPPPPVPQNPQPGLPAPGQFGTFDPNAYVPPPPPAPTVPINNPAQLPAPQPQPQPAPPAPQPGVTWDQVYQDLSRQTGHPVETYRQMINGNPAVLASVVGEALGQITRGRTQPAPAPVPQPQPQPPRQIGRVEIPDSVKPYLKEMQGGVIEALHPAYSEWAAIANSNLIQSREAARRFAEDPTSILKDPTVQQLIDQKVKEQFGQYSSQVERMNVRNQMKAKYGKELAQHDANGQMIMNPMDPNKPLPTALGAAVQTWCQRLVDQGMQETADMYETAIFRAKQELGMLNQPPAQPQFQPQYQPQQPTLWGNPGGTQPMYQPPTGPYGAPNAMAPYGMPPAYGMPAQPFVPPAMAAVQQQQNNANTMWPGQPPARQHNLDPNMPFDQQLNIILSTAPEGLGMDQYMKFLGM